MPFLAIALAIPWVFWGAMIGLLIAANFTSAREVFWASLVLHLFFLVALGGSFAAFMLKERKNRK